MKKGEIYEGYIDKIDFPNKGRVHVGENLVTVKNGICGQKVRFLINKKRKGNIQGRLLEVLEKSPKEMNTLCDVFPSCGGCMYQTLPYEEQLKMKETQVEELLSEAIQKAGQDEEYIFEPILGSPNSLAYRNKMEYSFGDDRKDGPLTLGLHKKASTYDVLTTKNCKIVDEDFNKIVSCILDYARENDLPYFHKMSHEGYLRHLLLRRSQTAGEHLVCLVTSSQKEWDFTDLCNHLLDLPLKGKISGILHIINDSLADVVKSDETRLLYGKADIQEKILGLEFKITPFSFFQTNTLGAEVLYSVAREYVGDTKDKVIFDLYSGTGTIAQIMAPVAKKVIGVEIVEEAVVAARENTKKNHLDNCEFIAGDVLKVLDEIEETPDFIMLDPPREGIHPKALEKIIDYGVDNLVYISCKPTSLARDLDTFIKRGYVVKKIRCVDMFPMTVHVESVVLLTKTHK